ncbi:outer spore coat protein CotE [Thermoactinomyces sp. CICC 10735]|nr:outer spore coat protein CotE [Thermoactinomyces sp. CICC 10735]
MVSYPDRAMEYRQIITKAVCGKGRRFLQSTHTVKSPENIHTILGAWVINHQYECTKVGEAVEVSGKYDVNIWYSTKGNTKTDVIKETVYYTEQVPLSYYDRNTRDSTVTVSATVTQAPNCVEASIASHTDGIADGIVVRVEKEFAVEMVGQTKICVPVYPLEYAETDEKDLAGSYEEHVDEDSFDELDPDLIIDDLED